VELTWTTPKDLNTLFILNKLRVLNKLGGKMTAITLSIPEELKKQMDEFEDINWSAVAREAIKNRLSQLILFKSIVSESKLTEKDALKIGKKVNASLHKRFKEEK
jgi:hypothetical protein